MSELAYETKKEFVVNALSRCVAAMYPNVCRLSYAITEDGYDIWERVMIHLTGGYSRRVDVTGLDLRETLDAVLAAIEEAA